MDEIQQNTEGLNFDMTIKDETGAEVDTSSASSRLLIFRKPSGVVLRKTASQVSGGLIRYTSATGDLDETGVWQWEGKVTLGGFVKPTDVHQFRVRPTLE